MIPFIPPVNTRGLFTLTTPFDTALLENVPYTVVSVRRLSDIVAAGENPFELYYDPIGLTEVDYQADVDAEICILSLQSDTGMWVYVPHSYISTVPDIGGIPYTTIALAVSLSAIPDSLDLTYLKTQISELVTDTIGIDLPEVKTVVISSPTIISHEDHALIEAAREENIATLQTERAQKLEMKRQRDTALLKVAELEAYIIANLPP